MPSVQQKRGLHAALPTTGLKAGEIHLATDRQSAHFPTDATTMVPIVPPIEELISLGAINGAADLLIIHDADGSGVKEKKITFDAFKTALNIPAGSTDEQVAVVSGGAAGYIWGTDGTDGILRMGTTMAWQKDAGNAYVTLDVDSIDCGTF